MSETKRTGTVAKFGDWLIRKVASEVPPDIALCEHGCRKRQCLQQDWEHCERRLAFIKRMKAESPEIAKTKSRKQAVARKPKATRTYARRPRDQTTQQR